MDITGLISLGGILGSDPGVTFPGPFPADPGVSIPGNIPVDLVMNVPDLTSIGGISNIGLGILVGLGIGIPGLIWFDPRMHGRALSTTFTF